MNKQQRHDAIRERAADAIRDMYHNATPVFPILDDDEAEHCWQWFGDAARDEIDYIASGGAYNDRPTDTTADFVAGKYANPKTAAYARRRYMQNKQLERARCNRLDSRDDATNAHWEKITSYGKLYTWGRGGRTLAPDDLVKQGGGGSFGMKESIPDDLSISDCVELIQIVESFNRHVADWCESVPDMWREYSQEQTEAENTTAARVIEATRPDMYQQEDQP